MVTRKYNFTCKFLKMRQLKYLFSALCDKLEFCSASE